jgi:hypothetical protein
MERNYNNREFEQYVKSNADQYRMIPSEKVWRGINNSLHTRRKWYGFGLASLLFLTAVSVTWVMLSYPSKQQMAANPAQASAKSTILIEPANPVHTSIPSQSSSDINKLLSLNKFDKSESITVANNLPVDRAKEIELPENNTGVFTPTWNTGHDVVEVTVNSPSVVTTDKKQQPGIAVAGASGNAISTNMPQATIPDQVQVAEKENIVMNKVPFHTEANKPKQHSVLYPLTIESVVNHKPKKIHKKLSWQLYVAPTVSYRRLKANKEYRTEGPFADPVSYPFSSLTDINKAVTHKPDMGLELGFSARYPVSKNVKLRAGFQFNINRYDIKAFVYNGEQATINLNGNNNSVTAWTYYRNYNGYKSDWLKNFYFSVSAPLGAELKLFGNKKTNFGIAGTVQPTYILREKAYLISTDYKNYAKVPWLIRDLNVNTSFETFINYTSRTGVKWQVGPQVRYQVLSSFHTKYPVKENLFDFGLKIGVSLD